MVQVPASMSEQYEELKTSRRLPVLASRPDEVADAIGVRGRDYPPVHTRLRRAYEADVLVARRPRIVLTGAACALFMLVFFGCVLFEQPGLGIGHFFYIPVVLLALASGPWLGILGGLAATSLYAAGVWTNEALSSSDVPVLSMGIRLATFVLIGVGFGWFVSRTRSSQERLRILAERDYLTGVANGHAFDGALRRRLAHGAPFALLIGDMDSLKRVNDERGHPEGDRAIQTAAQVLLATSRPNDHVARIGGDEFALIADGADRAVAESLAERLEQDTARAGVPLTLGCAFFPADGGDARALYRVADRRLYQRKRGGDATQPLGPSRGRSAPLVPQAHPASH